MGVRAGEENQDLRKKSTTAEVRWARCQSTGNRAGSRRQRHGAEGGSENPLKGVLPEGEPFDSTSRESPAKVGKRRIKLGGNDYVSSMWKWGVARERPREKGKAKRVRCLGK